MILTVTMNPSVDMSYPLKHLKINDVNRVKNVSKTAGGKGLNVARVLHLLGASLNSTGIIGGHLGDFIKDQLDKDHIKHNFFEIDQETRNCLALLHDGGQQTEVLEAGPTINKVDAEGFLDFFKKLSKDYSLVTMSGSLLQGVPADFYNQMITIVHQNGNEVFLDTSGKSLELALMSSDKPDLIKPNEEELANLVNKKFDSKNVAAIKNILQEPIFNHVSWIVVSLGADGCVARHNNQFYKVDIPKIKVVNPVGSGDSTIAGLAYAVNKKLADEDVLKYGMAAGMLNTMERETGWIKPQNLPQTLDSIKVKEI